MQTEETDGSRLRMHPGNHAINGSLTFIAPNVRTPRCRDRLNIIGRGTINALSRGHTRAQSLNLPRHLELVLASQVEAE